MPDIFDKNGYICELQIDTANDTLIVTIAKGQPFNEVVGVTKEEGQRILETVGKWQITDRRMWKYYVECWAAAVLIIVGAGVILLYRNKMS